MLKGNDWLEGDTKDYALKKAHEMLALIGYPDMAFNDTELDEYYELLKIDKGDSYAILVHKYSVWAQEKAFRRLQQPVDRLEFGTSSAVVNAFYSSIKNEITFPAAILRVSWFLCCFISH